MQPIPSVVPKGYNDPPPGSGLARYQRQAVRLAAVRERADLHVGPGAAGLREARRHGDHAGAGPAGGDRGPAAGDAVHQPGRPGRIGHLVRRLLQPGGAGGLRHRRLGPSRRGVLDPGGLHGAAELDRFYALDALAGRPRPRSSAWTRGGAGLRAVLPGAVRRAAAARVDGGDGQGPGAAAGAGRRRQDQLLRVLVRDPDRGHLRRALPAAGRPDGARRVGEHQRVGHHQPDRGLRAGAEQLRALVRRGALSAGRTARRRCSSGSRPTSTSSTSDRCRWAVGH